ncbi:MAG: Gfo/Idh/MocA family oxidoreductase [Anaerolineae bacterium]|nr:Gfo/Idh/MocA family oxidoreductase [Anaerolineae bacterium]
MPAAIHMGVIGLGRMGTVYAYHVARQIDNARLVAVADPRQEVTDEFASKVPGVAVFADYHELLAQPDVHGVIVASPTHTHRDVVIAAAEAGKAIFCEKPTALTLAATDEMIAAVERAGVLFQVGFMRRFDEGYARAKRQIDDGLIGEPVAIRSIGRDAGRTSLEFANPAVSGGLILDMGIHDFDLLRWYMGAEVERVHTEVASLVFPELQTVNDVDYAMINLRFENGALGNVEVSRDAVYGYDIQTEIVGSKGTLKVGYLQQTPVLITTQAGVTHDIVPHFPQRFGPAYTRQIEHFADCLVHSKAPSITAKDARAALQIGVAATRSQHSGQVVYLRDTQS